MLRNELEAAIPEVKDFPKPGINFKDITGLLMQPALSTKVVKEILHFAEPLKPDAIAGIESRGFMFGFALAQELQIPFIPVRKPGKLPRKVLEQAYDLEYGKDAVQVHHEDLESIKRVLIHDDLLATGGTAAATASLFEKAGCHVVGMSFIMELSFLQGRDKLPQDTPQQSLLVY